jgi:hypothetical protein
MQHCAIGALLGAAQMGQTSITAGPTENVELRFRFSNHRLAIDVSGFFQQCEFCDSKRRKIENIYGTPLALGSEEAKKIHTPQSEGEQQWQIN